MRLLFAGLMILFVACAAEFESHTHAFPTPLPTATPMAVPVAPLPTATPQVFQHLPTATPQAFQHLPTATPVTFPAFPTPLPTTTPMAAPAIVVLVPTPTPAATVLPTATPFWITPTANAAPSATPPSFAPAPEDELVFDDSRSILRLEGVGNGVSEELDWPRQAVGSLRMIASGPILIQLVTTRFGNPVVIEWNSPDQGIWHSFDTGQNKRVYRVIVTTAENNPWQVGINVGR